MNITQLPLGKQIKQLAYLICPTAMEKRAHKKRYEHLAKETADRYFAFMNYGYAPIDEKEPIPELSSDDEPHRFHIQLYHHVASQIDLEDLDVLDVGSGRGGGSYYIKSYLNSRTVAGVDLSKSAVELSGKAFCVNGLSYMEGDAESLSFEDNRFDVVVNVESSHCYPNIDKFYREVKRVLRPGGHFLYADFGSKARMNEVKRKLKESGLVLIKSTDITRNVVESLKLNNERMTAFLREIADNEDRYQDLASFARLVGTEGYYGFCDGQEFYESFVLQKR